MIDNLYSILPLLVTSIVTGMVTYGISYRKMKTSVEFKYIDSILSDNKRLREVESEKLEDEIKYGQDLRELTLKVDLIGNSLGDLPLPHWSKTLEGKYLFANKRTVEVFFEPYGHSYASIMGKTDVLLLPKQIGEISTLNDKITLRSKKECKFVEELIVNGKLEKWNVIRFPIFKGGYIVAIGGVAHS